MIDRAHYARYFYLRKVKEAEQRAQFGDYYDLIMAAGLIRHLLLEDAPLIHKANKDLRIKLRFTIARTEGHHVPGPQNIDVRGIDPDPPCPYPIETVSAKNLLSAYCMTSGVERFTVKDILESCAYARGGVHLNSSLAWRDILLFSIDGYEPLASTPSLLRGIIKVIVRGLRPLTDTIEEEFAAQQVVPQPE